MLVIFKRVRKHEFSASHPPFTAIEQLNAYAALDASVTELRSTIGTMRKEQRATTAAVQNLAEEMDQCPGPHFL